MKKQLLLGLVLLGAATGLNAKVLETKEIKNTKAVDDWNEGNTNEAKNICYKACNFARQDKNIKGVRANQENSIVAKQGARLMCTCTDGK